jgi:photosystem II stability/assembly factor-like uncharacterized protein
MTASPNRPSGHTASRYSPGRLLLLGTTLALAAGGSACADAYDATRGGAGDADAAVDAQTTADGEPRRAFVSRPDSLLVESVEVGTDALLIGISAPDPDVIWMSGTGGTWLRSTDGGASWSSGQVAGQEEAQFRDVHGFDARNAVLLAIGEGTDSRIFRTEDGGATWSERFVMDLPDGFLDCMDFWDGERGAVYGDAVDGGMYILRTGDGGRSWERVDPATLPPALEGEGGFAASGTCLTAGEGGVGWVATGNGTRPRLLTTEDYGATWTAAELPLAAGSGQGGTSVDFSDLGLGFVLGGNISGAEQGVRVVLSADGGRSWSTGGAPAMEGAIYGGAWVPESYGLVAAGPGGLDWSPDGGLTWFQLSGENHWSVGFSSPGTGWATGPDGRVTRLTVVRP